MGFARHAMPKDGDCLFHCLGAMVGESAATLRAKVVQQMAAHVDRYYLEADLDAAAEMPLSLAWLSEKAGKVRVQSLNLKLLPLYFSNLKRVLPARQCGVARLRSRLFAMSIIAGWKSLTSTAGLVCFCTRHLLRRWEAGALEFVMLAPASGSTFCEVRFKLYTPVSCQEKTTFR